MCSWPSRWNPSPVDAILRRSMGTLVQIRDVPEGVHRTLKARAAAAGMTLSEYLRGLLEQAASRPTPQELAARIRVRGRLEPGEPSEAIVRRLRERGE